MVHVNNQNDRIPPLSGDFTIFGGIYRNVWLISAGKAAHQPHRLRLYSIYVDLPSVSEERAEISVRGTLVNRDVRRALLKLDVEVLDADGKIRAQSLRQRPDGCGRGVRLSRNGCSWKSASCGRPNPLICTA